MRATSLPRTATSRVVIDWSKVNNPELKFNPFTSRRSQVYGIAGVVSSSQPLATEAGQEILRRGGNAADAAVAVAAALNVTEPGSCGIGGDAFCLFYDVAGRKVKGINGSGRAPRRLTIDLARKSGATGRKIPTTNTNSITVPGAAAAWVDTVDQFGSGRMTMSDVLAPAIKLATCGFPVSELNSFAFQQSEELLRTAPNGLEMLLDGSAPLPGQIMQYPNLARTFQIVAKEGKDGFYRGKIAEAVVEVVQSGGGVMDKEDLAMHQSALIETIRYTYGGEVTIHECPPNGQGITALLALGILEALQTQNIVKPLSEMDHNSPEYLHTLIEALRIAFADTQYYVADPNFGHIPIQELLSKEYLTSRARLFDPGKANRKIVHGQPLHSSDTVYFAVTDQWGNACSFIMSNSSAFGNGAVPRGCGFTLQSRGSGFILQEGHPNALEGGKRPYHTIIPAMATRGDDLFLCYGVMGGFMQPQGHVQVLLNLLRGFTAQSALDAPRFCVGPPDPDGEVTTPAGYVTTEVFLEEGIPVETAAKLQEMGHEVKIVHGFERQIMGRGQIIQRIVDSRGRVVWAAGSDPRGDGHAVAQL